MSLMYRYSIGIAELYSTSRHSRFIQNPTIEQLTVLKQIDIGLVDGADPETLVQQYQTLTTVKTREALLTAVRGRKETVKAYVEARVTMIKNLIYPNEVSRIWSYLCYLI